MAGAAWRGWTLRTCAGRSGTGCWTPTFGLLLALVLALPLPAAGASVTEQNAEEIFILIVASAVIGFMTVAIYLQRQGARMLKLGTFGSKFSKNMDAEMTEVTPDWMRDLIRKNVERSHDIRQRLRVAATGFDDTAGGGGVASAAPDRDMGGGGGGGGESSAENTDADALHQTVIAGDGARIRRGSTDSDILFGLTSPSPPQSPSNRPRSMQLPDSPAERSGSAAAAAPKPAPVPSSASRDSMGSNSNNSGGSSPRRRLRQPGPPPPARSSHYEAEELDEFSAVAVGDCAGL